MSTGRAAEPRVVPAFLDGGGEVARLIAAADWSGSALGPPSGWSPTLRAALAVCLSSRFPMLVWWGEELSMLYNDAYVPILGGKHPRSLGQPGAECWSDVWPVVGGMLAGVVETGEATYDEDLLLVMNRHGFDEETYFTFSYSPVREDDGRVAGVFTAVTETTGRVLGERRLRTLRRLGELSVTGGVSVREACAAALGELARSRADVPFAEVHLREADGSLRPVAAYGLRRGARGASPLAAHPADAAALREVAATGRPTRLTGLSERHPGALAPGGGPAGGAAPQDALLLPLSTGAGGPAAGVIVLGLSPYLRCDGDYRSFAELVAGHVATAIGDLAAFEAERRRVRELAELDRARTAFFTGVSHEFRTPLTLITGPLAELRAAPDIDPERLRTELDVAHRNGLRLHKLVSALLDFSQLEAGRMRAAYEPVDLGAVTADLAGTFRGAVAQAGLRLTVDCAALDEPVHVDREMWEKIVLNLLSNALKYTFDGEIEIVVDRVGSAARLRVRDTGVGIATDQLPRLFERFHRIQRVRGRSNEGSGIGLALVKELVALHGGRVDVASEPGRGSTFTVTLPLGTAHLPDGCVVGSPTAAPARSDLAESYLSEALRWLPDGARDAPDPNGGVAAAAAGGGTVLVVDDNADMRAYLGRLLGAQHAVTAVADGRAALAAARAAPPDLVVTDVMMPGLDGLELVAALRADPRTAQVPVLVLSARADQEAAVEGLAAGADDYLVKPFSAAELRARVGAHVRLGQLRRAAEERFRAVADLAPAMIWVTRPDGRSLFRNRAWRAFTGHDDVADAYGHVHSRDRERYRSVRERAVGERQPYEVEYRLRRADGAYHWVLERAVPIGAGDDAGYVGTCVDIHARHRETERQTLLATIAAETDAEPDADRRMARVARLMVEHRLADQCTITRTTDGGALERVAAAAADPETEAVLAGLREVVPVVREVAAAGRARLLAEVGDDVRFDGASDPAERAARRATAIVSGVLVPLVARGTVLGVLALGRRDDAPRYTADDLAEAEAVAERVAAALDTALLMSEERAATLRLELLQRATARLSAAATPRDVAEVAVREIGALLGIEAVGMWERRDGVLDALDLGGWPDEVHAEWTSAPLDADVPLCAAVRRGETIWLADLDDVRRAYPHMRDTVAGYGFGAVGFLPVRAVGRCNGVIAVGFPGPRSLGPAERSVLRSLAGLCGQALERSRLLSAESTARETAQRLNLVVGALSGTADLDDVGRVIVEVGIELGAAGVVVVLRDGDRIEPLVVRDHALPSGLTAESAHPLAYAVRTGEPVWLGTRSEVVWGEAHFDAAGGVGAGHMALPLIADGATVGAIGLRFAGSAPALTPEQRALVVTLAGQCAQAVTRARLHQAELAARRQAESAAARQRALVAGLAAIVWEADPATGRFSFVSSRAEEILGHPVQRWLDDTDFWPSIIHDDDREAAVARRVTETAAGRDHDVSYRVRTADGRLVWLHDLVHVVCDEAGRPVGLQGVMIDVSEQKRAERDAAVLVTASRLLAETGDLDRRLHGLAAATIGVLGDSAVVALLHHDDRLHAVAAVHRDPDREPLLTRSPHRPSAEVVERLRGGSSVILPKLTDELWGHDPDGEAVARGLDQRAGLLVPLTVQDTVIGALVFATTDPVAAYDAANVALGEELARRTAAVMDAARLHERAVHLQDVTAALASAATVQEAARALVDGVRHALGATAAAVYQAMPDRRLRLVHAAGYDAEATDAHAILAPEERLPSIESTRSGRPVWLGDVATARARFPRVAAEMERNGHHAVAVLPMRVQDRVVGTVFLSFGRARVLLPDEREFALALAQQVAQAFERAVAADERREIADVLQRSLLPPTMPRLSRLALAAQYLPAAGAQSGGDWYEVLPLDERRAAFVVGDVVGQGASAAAVMGQLRSALAGYLIEGHGPAAALERLSAFARRLDGALASSVACLVLDQDSGELRWARAGHPPPLLLDPDGARYLEIGAGSVLGVVPGQTFDEGRARLEPGTTVLLYTDGLVERRGEDLDRGFRRLAGAAAEHRAEPPEALAGHVLREALDGGGPADDVAIVVARYLPAPLRLRLPADPAQLRPMRAEIDRWGRRAVLSEDELIDLQLAVGEAAANAVEHAYRPGEPGEVLVDLDWTDGGSLRAGVRDFGRWRPVPVDRGSRGRGLDVMRSLSRGFRVVEHPDGTEVRLEMSRLAAAAEPEAPAPVPAAARAAAARVRVDPGRIVLSGELDLAGVGAVRPAVLAALDGTAGDVLLDLAGVTFLASSGIGLLGDLAHLAASRGRRVRIAVGPNAVVAQVLALAGIGEGIEIEHER